MPLARRLAPLPTVVERELHVPGLDPRHDGLRLAQLSDIHCGHMTPRRHVRAAVEAVNGAEPDLICLTGDYVSFSRREVSIMQGQLSGLEAAPTFAVLGNHDYYADGDAVAEALGGCGYTVLRNQHRTLRLRGAFLHVIGLDDPVTRRHNLQQATRGLAAEGTRLVLSHCPELVGQLAEKGADVVLAGHTHGGQINVGRLMRGVFDRMGRQYMEGGVYRVKDTVMHLTAGVGFSGVRIRAGRGTRAEVAVLTLRGL